MDMVNPYLHPMVLTSSGGHRNMYDWQAGGTHPTGMLSCMSNAFGDIRAVACLLSLFSRILFAF